VQISLDPGRCEIKERSPTPDQVMLSLHTASRFNWISGKKNLARKAPSLARPQEKQYLPQWTSPDVCLNVIIWSLFSETRPSRIHTAALDYLLGMDPWAPGAGRLWFDKQIQVKIGLSSTDRRTSWAWSDSDAPRLTGRQTRRQCRAAQQHVACPSVNGALPSNELTSLFAANTHDRKARSSAWVNRCQHKKQARCLSTKERTCQSAKETTR